MLTLGHIATSYLITEGAMFSGVPLSNSQVLGTILIGNLPDIDFLTGFITGKKGERHHQNITHTPLGNIILWILITLIFKTSYYFSFILWVTLFSHLILDDIGHWFYKLKLHKYPVGQQINWLYPITKFSNHTMPETYTESLKIYLTKAWPTALLEILIIVVTIFVLISS
jgi:hypothetical protein